MRPRISWGFWTLARRAGSALITAASLSSSDADAQDESWWDGFTSGNAPNARVHAMLVHNGSLFCAGQFTSVAGIPSGYVAAWSGTAWSSPAGGVNGQVEALATYGANLVAVGGFSTAGGVTAQGVAVWNGTTWSALGGGLTPYGIAAISFGSDLVASDGAARIWRWNGASWSQMGASLGTLTRAFAVYGGQLYAGGDYSGGVRRWDGSAWQTVGGGVTGGGNVFALTVHASSLVVGGNFTTAGGQPAAGIAAWNGSSWSAFGSGMNGSVYALGVQGGALVAAGNFSVAGGVPAAGVARWNGTAWRSLGSGLAGSGMAVREFGTGLYVGGDFVQAGGKPSEYVARWSGKDCNLNGVEDFLDILQGTSPDCNANGVPDSCDIAAGTSQDCNANRIPDSCEPDCDGDGIPDACDTVSGLDCNANGIPDSCDIARNTSADCDGNGVPDECDPDCDHDGIPDACEPNDAWWNGLGSNPHPNARVHAMLAADSVLYCGGQFAGFMARWNGSSWSTAGMAANQQVEAIVKYHNLVAAVGGFTVIGGVPAPYVALWNGAQWSRPGTFPGSTLRTAAVYQGDLIVGGDGGCWRWNGASWSTFGTSGATMLFVWNGDLYNGTSRWNGTTFQSIGAANGSVWGMCEYQSRLVMTGAFSTIGGAPMNGIAAWDGATWTALGTGLTYDPPGAPPPGPGAGYDVAVYQNRLYATGFFNLAGGVPASGVATWDGSAWRSLGAGLSGGASTGYSLSAYLGALYVGGIFDQAGGHNTPMFARWSACSDCNGNGIDDRTEIQNGTAQDLNGNGLPDSCDIASGGSTDCNSNGVPDEIEPDCDGDGIPNSCEPFGGGPDCNANNVSDACDIASGVSFDCNQNGVPDECEPDCDGDGIPNACETMVDCNQNGVMDACDIASGTSLDCDQNGVPDDCQADCDGDGIPTVCESQVDCNANGIPDHCDIAAGAPDCDANGVPDGCQPDANHNGIADACDIASGRSPDCNGNGVPDSVDVAPATVAFQRVFNMHAPVDPMSVAACDLDHDGRTDVIVPGNAGTGMRVFWNEGGGTFTSQVYFGEMSFGEVVAGQFDEYPGSDVALFTVGGGTGNFMLIVHGGSRELLGPTVRPMPFNGNYYSSHVVACGDSLQNDIALPDYNLNVVPFGSLVGFFDWDAYPYPNGFYPAGAAAADVDRDGRIDILVSGGGNPDGFIVLRGVGLGVYAAPVFYPISYSGYAASIVAADFNGDLYPDVAVGRVNALTQLSVSLNLGDGTFGPPQDFSFPSTGVHFTRLAAADVNRDGKLDVVAAVPGSPIAGDYGTTGRVVIALGNGDGTFQSPAHLVTDVGVVIDLAVADFDSDGWPDFVTAGQPSAYHYPIDVTIELNRSTGPPTSIDSNGDWIPDECQPLDVTSPADRVLLTRLLGPATNPVHAQTAIRFELAQGSDVRLELHDLAGRLVRRWQGTGLTPGRHEIPWDGRDDSGSLVPSGVYFVRFQAGPVEQSGKIVRMR